MKTKTLLLAALVSTSALSTLSANAGVRFGFGLGFPAPVVVAPAPVVVATAPVVVASPVVVAAPPVVVAPAVVAVPPCPGVDYVWTPGYWTYGPAGRVWIGGCWGHRPGYVARGTFRGARRW
jgi:hypothetical protein